MLGNVLIAVLILAYGSLVSITAKSMPSGDYGVGYAFVWLISGTAFVVSGGLLAWYMNHHNNFDWAPDFFLRYQNWMVFLTWLAFSLALVWSLEYRTKWIDGKFPTFLRWFIQTKVYLWLPALILLPSLYLLNAQRPEGFAPIWIKLPIQIGFWVSIALGLVVLYGLVKSSVQRRIAHAEAVKEAKAADNNESWGFNKSMESIENYKDAGIQRLLTYTHREQDERIRAAALAKIKTFANWEAQLVDTLNQGALNEAYWVVAFLDGNQVDKPEQYLLPLKNSLKRLAPAVQASLKDPDSLDMGFINIEALCRVLDKYFKGDAMVFKPGMEVLQKALNTSPPARKDKRNKQWFEETLATSRVDVGKWLEAN